MMFQLPSQKGRRQNEVFIVHSDFSLAHRWAQNGILHAQSISDNVVKEVSVIKSDETYHIFGINASNQLFCLKRSYLNYDYQWGNELTIIDNNVGGQLKLTVIETKPSFYLYTCDQNGRIMLLVLSKESLKQQLRLVVGEESKYKRDVQIVKFNEKCHFISYILNEQAEEVVFGFLDIQNPSKIQWTSKNVQLSKVFKITAAEQRQIVMIGQDFNQNLCKIEFIIPSFQLKSTKIVDRCQKFMINNQKMTLITKQSQQYLYIVNNQEQIWEIEAKSTKKRLICSAGQKILDFCVFHHDNEDNLYYLNQKELLVWLQGQNGKWSRRESKKTLIWEQVSNYFEPIGDPGWHADAFYSKELGIVAKKMRKQNTYQVNDEIRVLDYLSHFTNNRCLHQIYCKKVLHGLTMNFIPGIKWDSILSQKDNLFAKSPIARVQFVCKLTNAIKILQQNRFCHGDLHLSNILIDIKSHDEISPQFSIEVIDYGNGFVFKEGELVTEGMTGLEIIVPLEVESIRKKNFDPIGVNAYQLGRNILQILLLSKHSEVDRLEYFATQELIQLKARSQYPYELYEFANGLLQEDPRQRNVWLFKDIDHLVQKTRLIFLQPKSLIQ